jgi:linoleoyl-CoA desaturase
MSIPTITFKKDHNAEFYKELRKRVNGYFKEKNISRYANVNMVLKTIFMVALYLTPFVFMITIVTNPLISLLLWVLIGFGMAGVGLSVMHDANHGAYSKRPWVNKTFGFFVNFLGGSDVNWKIQHNVLHHTYTNVHGMDEDIDAGAILRLSPHQKRRTLHRFQHLYAWFFYGLMTVAWFLTKDYKQVVRFSKMDLLATQNTSFRKALAIIIGSKIVYGGVFFVLPFFIAPVAWYYVLIGIFLMQFTCGLTLGAIFQPAHIVPTSDFPKPDESGNVEADWAVNQLYNTSNFAPGARLFSWYVGGLNYQVEHHLFPNICHVHYRKLSKIVRETAMEYNLPYYSYKTFYNALSEHTSMLKNLGKFDNAQGIH